MNFARLGKNALFYAVGTVGIRTAGFFLIPIYTYSMSIADYGLLSVLLQTAQIMVILVGMGSRTALMRFAKEYEERNEIGLLIGTTVFINVLGAVMVAAISSFPLLPLFRSVLHTDNALRYVLLTCAAAAPNCLAIHLMGYYRAGHKGLWVTVASLAGALSLIILTLICVRTLKLGIGGALISQAVIYSLLSVFFLTSIAAHTRLRVSFSLARKLIRFGLPLILVMAGSLITQGAAFYFLSYFGGLSQVGIYSLGVKIALIVEMVLILPFQMAYEPFVYGATADRQLWDAISRLLTYSITAFAFTAAGIAFVARDLLPLIAPPAFGSAYPLLFMILPALVFRSVYYVGESLLLLEKKSGLAATVVTIFTVASLPLNYFLISRWGMYGAAAAMSVTVVGTGATVMKLGLRMAPVCLERNRLLAAGLLLLVFLSIVYWFRSASTYVYYTCVPAAICAAIALLYASSFIREDERRVIESFIRRVPQLRSVFGV